MIIIFFTALVSSLRMGWVFWRAYVSIWIDIRNARVRVCMMFQAAIHLI